MRGRRRESNFTSTFHKKWKEHNRMEEVDSTFRRSNKSLTSGDIDVVILNLQTEDNIETPSAEEEEQEEVSSLEYSQDDSFQSRRLSLELTDPLEMTCDKLTPRSSVSFWTCCEYKPSKILLGIGISLLFVGILIGTLSPLF